jgi:molybdopterin synthase sulfur carrier subunit
VPYLRLFGPARTAAGLPIAEVAEIAGTTVGEVLAAATARFGPAFGEVADTAQVWVNGEAATADESVDEEDEVAVVPPVSGG